MLRIMILSLAVLPSLLMGQVYVKHQVLQESASSYVWDRLNNVEDYQYEVLATYPNFEIRKYKKAIFSSVDMRTDGYESTSRSGFRILAGYIFGGNETGEQIAMTSPVAMSIDGEKPKMSFMVRILMLRPPIGQGIRNPSLKLREDTPECP